MSLLKEKKKNIISSISKNLVYSIYINSKKKVFEIMSITKGDISNADIIKLPYKTRNFDDEFFAKMESTFEKFMADKPANQAIHVYLVLPNGCVSNDIINIPTMTKNKIQESLKNIIENQYKNHNDLQFSNILINQNKQFSTYTIKSINKELVKRIYTVLSNTKLYPKNVTYYANALMNAVYALKPKTRNHTFWFLDIKSDSSDFVFSYKGKTMGSYSLMFGYKALYNNKVVSENMLHNHPLAEITVLNAIEKAKAKQLTVISDINDAEVSQDENENKVVNQSVATTEKVLEKKVPRKMPKNLQREIPSTSEGMIVENFRMFVKWTLLLIKENSRYDLGAKAEYVLVNMPKEYNFVLDEVNLESKENGVEFVAFNDEDEEFIYNNLALYGSIRSGEFNKEQNF